MIYEAFRWLAIITGAPFLAIYFKTKIYYEDKAVSNRHVKGPALIIGNHFGVPDFIVSMYTLFPRKINIVSAEYPYRNKLNAFGMRFFHGILADRRVNSLRFMDESVKCLRKGELVQIFPEGHNTDDGTIKPFMPSYLMIALRADVPIIPIITDGQYGLFKRNHILIGKPIYLDDLCTSVNPSREEIVQMNEAVRGEALRLQRLLETMKGKKTR